MHKIKINMSFEKEKERNKTLAPSVCDGSNFFSEAKPQSHQGLVLAQYNREDIILDQENHAYRM